MTMAKTKCEALGEFGQNRAITFVICLVDLESHKKQMFS